MKFQSYFVRFSHSQKNFTTTLMIGKQTFRADFQQVDTDLYIIFFRQQLNLHRDQLLYWKDKKRTISVLFPVIAKFNQRKMKKMIQFLQNNPPREIEEISLRLLAIEKYIHLIDLLPFLQTDRKTAEKILLNMELQNRIKILSWDTLWITPIDHICSLLQALTEVMQDAFENRKKSIHLPQVEKLIKVPYSSLFFRYLLQKITFSVPFSIKNNSLIIHQLPMSEKEKEAILQVHQIIKKNRLAIFSIDQLLKFSELGYASINDSVWYMLHEKQIVQISEQHFILEEEYVKIVNRLKKYKRNQHELISIDDIRQISGYTRKYIIILLEFLDSQQITERVGNQRKILIGV